MGLPSAYTLTSTSGGQSFYEEAAYCEYGAARGGVDTDALHRHGVPGLAGRAHRRGGDRALSARDERGAAGHDLCDKRDTLCGDAAGGGGDRPRARRGRGRGDEPLRGVQPLLRRCGLRDTLRLCRAHRLPLDRRRPDGDEPAHTRLRAAVHRALERALGLFHRLRAHLEALAGAPSGAALLRGAGGAVPLAGARRGTSSAAVRRWRRA